MVYFVWEFLARAERIAEFERIYASSGSWAKLFAKSPGFHGTSLLHDSQNPRRFLTIDRWDNIDAQSAMRNVCPRIRATRPRLRGIDGRGAPHRNLRGAAR